METNSDKIMFAITKINEDGVRTLARANQGRNHFETKKLAEQYLKDVLAKKLRNREGEIE
jgi:hypothetical protein